MSGVEELEIEMPEDMEDPEEVGEALAEGAAAALGGEGEGGKTTDLPGLGSPNGQGNAAPHQLVQMIKTNNNLNKNKKDPL